MGEISPGLVETEFAAAHMKSSSDASRLYRSNPTLQAADVTRAVLYMVMSPPHVEVHDILVRPTAQKF